MSPPEPIPVPPPLPVLDTEGFRLALAGFADPFRELGKGDKSAEPVAIQNAALDFLLIARRLYNTRVLAVLKVWTKLFSAVEVALAAAGADDTTTFASATLGGVFASASRVATDNDLATWLNTYGTDSTVRDVEFRTALLRLIRRMLPVLPSLVQERYQQWRTLNPIRAAEDDKAESETKTEGEDD